MKGRVLAPVGRNLEQRLLAYAAAAGASLMAVQPAAAKVIYTRLNVTIENGVLPLDLNHDGVVDFNIFEKATSTIQGGGSRYLNVNSAGNPGGGVLAGRFNSVNALPPGAEIGPGNRFLRAQNVAGRMASRWFLWKGTSWSGLCSGAFAGAPYCHGVTDRFLGLRFVVSGKTYYGWAGFSVVKLGLNHDHPYVSARLTGVAYEDVPGQSIRAGQTQDDTATIERAPNPQPATLGLLALGAPGLDIWRKSEDA